MILVRRASFFAGAVVAATTGFSQPVGLMGVTTTPVPDYVLILPNGQMRLGPSSHSLDGVLGKAVPVFTQFADESVKPGIWIDPTRRCAMTPCSVVIERDKSVRLQTWTAVQTISTKTSGRNAMGTLPRMISLSETIPVRYAKANTLHQRGARGGFDLQWLVNTNTFPPGQAASIAQMLFRIETQFESLLALNGALDRIQFSFAQAPNPEDFAATTTFSNPRTYTQVKQFLQTFAGNEGETADEQLYAQFPPGSTIPVTLQNGAQANATTILVVAPMLGKWVQDIPANFDADMLINNQIAWDYNARDGINNGQVDLELTVTHEVIHTLGFNSAMDLGLPAGQLFLFDLFCMRREDIGDLLSLQEFRNSIRTIQRGVDVVAGMATSFLDGVARLSTGSLPPGDGFMADHWKAEELLQQENPPAIWIGVMDPKSDTMIPGYLSGSDKRAIDAFGWNINSNSPPLPPAPDQLQQPANGQQNVPLSPQLQWSPGGGAAARDVYVYRGTQRRELEMGLVGFSPGNSRAFRRGAARACCQTPPAAGAGLERLDL